MYFVQEMFQARHDEKESIGVPHAQRETQILNIKLSTNARYFTVLGPVLQTSIRVLVRYVELKAWVSWTTKVDLFKRRCITMVTYARNQTWSGAGFQLSLPGYRLLKSACAAS